MRSTGEYSSSQLRVQVQVVRRLVEQQQRRAAQQQLGERDAHLPSARKRLGRFVEIGLREPQALEHLGHAQLDAVAFVLAEVLGQLVIAHEEGLVLAVRQRRVGERVLDPIDLGARLEERPEGLGDFVLQRAARVRQPVLRQVAHGQRRRPGNRAGVRLVQAGQHPEQRRLARAVRSDQADALAVVHLPGDGVEQHAFAESFGKRLELNHREAGS